MLTLKTQPRETNLSKGELNKLRKAGQIPACLYGPGITNENFFVTKNDFERVYAKEGKIFQIEVSGTNHLVNTKVIQFEVVSHDLVHVSFTKLQKGQTTTVLVPVQTVGTALGEAEGGNPTVTYEKIKIDGIPSNIPSHIEVDISNLKIDQNIMLGDIKLPKGITLHDSEDPGQSVVNCNRPAVAPIETSTEVIEPELIGKDKDEPEAKAEGSEEKKPE